MISRGEIYRINLDPVISSKIAKTRPALVISNNINNEVAGTITILPIISKTDKVYPFEVLLHSNIASLHKESKVKANQIRTVDKKRVGKFIGSVDSAILKKVEQAIKLHLDMIQES